MERLLAVLTDKQESFVRAIDITGMSTHRACEATVVDIYLDCHAAMQERLIGNHALQLGKGPLGGGGVGLTLLAAGFLAFASLCPFTNVCQVFQADQAVGVSG